MLRFYRLFLLVVLSSAFPGYPAGLPDTGNPNCFLSGSATKTSSDDCRYGRDAAAGAGLLPKVGGGVAGFDYTKIANNGTELPASAVLGTASADWACVRDNVTGLMWEVKTAGSNDVRYHGHTYDWFNSDNSVNGGYAGYQDQFGHVCVPASPYLYCNTEAYTTAVNVASLCAHADWRLPTNRELLTLVRFKGDNVMDPAMIDADYFPNTPPKQFWTSTPSSQKPMEAWYVDFNNVSGGVSRLNPKRTFSSVRLVRGERF